MNHLPSRFVIILGHLNYVPYLSQNFNVHFVLHCQNCGKQCRSWLDVILWHLIWVYTVCSVLSFPLILRVNIMPCLLWIVHVCFCKSNLLSAWLLLLKWTCMFWICLLWSNFLVPFWTYLLQTNFLVPFWTCLLQTNFLVPFGTCLL